VTKKEGNDMLKFSRTLGEKDEVELTDAALAAIHGGTGPEHHHHYGRFGGLGGFYGGYPYGYPVAVTAPVTLAEPATTVVAAEPATTVVAAEPATTILAAEPVTSVLAAEPLVVAPSVGLGYYGFGRRRR
jgi:hypothetical protein